MNFESLFTTIFGERVFRQISSPLNASSMSPLFFGCFFLICLSPICRALFDEKGFVSVDSFGRILGNKHMAFCCVRVFMFFCFLKKRIFGSSTKNEEKMDFLDHVVACSELGEMIFFVWFVQFVDCISFFQVLGRVEWNAGSKQTHGSECAKRGVSHSLFSNGCKFYTFVCSWRTCLAYADCAPIRICFVHARRRKDGI